MPSLQQKRNKLVKNVIDTLVTDEKSKKSINDTHDNDVIDNTVGQVKPVQSNFSILITGDGRLRCIDAIHLIGLAVDILMSEGYIDE